MDTGAYLGKKGWIQGHILREITDLEFGTHSFLMNHVFFPTEQAETNICWIIYKDANFKTCLSLFGWKENVLPEVHIVQCTQYQKYENWLVEGRNYAEVATLKFTNEKRILNFTINVSVNVSCLNCWWLRPVLFVSLSFLRPSLVWQKKERVQLTSLLKGWVSDLSVEKFFFLQSSFNLLLQRKTVIMKEPFPLI